MNEQSERRHRVVVLGGKQIDGLARRGAVGETEFGVLRGFAISHRLALPARKNLRMFGHPAAVVVFLFVIDRWHRHFSRRFAPAGDCGKAVDAASLALDLRAQRVLDGAVEAVGRPGRRLLGLVVHVTVALFDQRGHAFIERVAFRLLLVDEALALDRIHAARRVRQVFGLDGVELLPPGLDVGHQVAGAGDDFAGSFRRVARHVTGHFGGDRCRRGGGLPGLFLDIAALLARTVGDHRAVDIVLQLDDLGVVRRFDHQQVAAVLRNRDVAAVAHLGDFAPHPLGIACAARLHGVDHDIAFARHAQHLGIFHVLRIVHVRRCVADQEHNAANLGALRPGQFRHRDVQRLVDALGPVAAAARVQLQQIGVEILDIGSEFEFFGDIVVADIAVGDQPHADFGIGIGIDDRGRDRPDFAFGALDQPTHRAGGVEHERDFDHGLTRDRLGGGLTRPNERQHKKSESRSPRAHSKHELTPSGWKNLRPGNVPWPSRRARAGIWAGYGPICGGICARFVGRPEARYEWRMKVDGKNTRTIWVESDGTCVGVIDQTLLPHRFATIKLKTLDDAVRAIKTMQVRGAPLIGAAAAYGVWLALREDASDENLERAAAALLAARPTAINLKWALDQMLAAVRNRPRSERVAAALRRAGEIADEDVAINLEIGRHGLKIIEAIAARKKGARVNVLTHCNAGWLATVDWGTATAPIYMAHDKGLAVHVFADETRPRNQGASLTAWELGHHGVPYTVIPDNTGGHLMQHGLVDLVIVGTDRVTAQGDVCNKIGTYLKALAAHDNNVPFYVALPSPTIDFSVSDGLTEIPIEQRSPDEVATMTGKTKDGRIETVQVVPDGSAVANYGFDVTPARLVTGLITERGVIAASRAALAEAFPERAGNHDKIAS